MDCNEMSRYAAEERPQEARSKAAHETDKSHTIRVDNEIQVYAAFNNAPLITIPTAVPPDPENERSSCLATSSKKRDKTPDSLSATSVQEPSEIAEKKHKHRRSSPHRREREGAREKSHSKHRNRHRDRAHKRPISPRRYGSPKKFSPPRSYSAAGREEVTVKPMTYSDVHIKKTYSHSERKSKKEKRYHDKYRHRDRKERHHERNERDRERKEREDRSHYSSASWGPPPPPKSQFSKELDEEIALLAADELTQHKNYSDTSSRSFPDIVVPKPAAPQFQEVKPEEKDHNGGEKTRAEKRKSEEDPGAFTNSGEKSRAEKWKSEEDPGAFTNGGEKTRAEKRKSEEDPGAFTNSGEKTRAEKRKSEEDPGAFTNGGEKTRAEKRKSEEDPGAFTNSGEKTRAEKRKSEEDPGAFTNGGGHRKERHHERKEREDRSHYSSASRGPPPPRKSQFSKDLDELTQHKNYSDTSSHSFPDIVVPKPAAPQFQEVKPEEKDHMGGEKTRAEKWKSEQDPGAFTNSGEKTMAEKRKSEEDPGAFTNSGEKTMAEKRKSEDDSGAFTNSGEKTRAEKRKSEEDPGAFTNGGGDRKERHHERKERDHERKEREDRSHYSSASWGPPPPRESQFSKELDEEIALLAADEFTQHKNYSDNSSRSFPDIVVPKPAAPQFQEVKPEEKDHNGGEKTRAEKRKSEDDPGAFTNSGAKTRTEKRKSKADPGACTNSGEKTRAEKRKSKADPGAFTNSGEKTRAEIRKSEDDPGACTNSGKKSRAEKRKSKADPGASPILIPDTPPNKQAEKEEVKGEKPGSPLLSGGSHSNPFTSALATNNSNDPIAPYLAELKNLQDRIIALENKSYLQRVIEIVKASRRFEWTEKYFEFDLGELDWITIKRLQDFMATID